MILGLLKLWMSSKEPLMDMDPPHPCPMTPTMIYLSMHVLGMIRLKRPDSPYGDIVLPPHEFYQVHARSSREAWPTHQTSL